MLRCPYTILILFLSLPCLSQADPFIEPDTGPPLERDQVRIGISFSLDHTDREVTGRTNAPAAYVALYDRRGFRSSRIGYTAGIDVRVPLGLELSLLTGARYADRGFRSRADAAPGEQPDALPDTVQLAEVTHGYHFQYLDIPLLLRLETGTRRLKPVLTAGLNLSYMLGAYRVLYDEIPEGRNQGHRIEDEFDFRRFNIFPVLGIGLVHYTTDRIWTRLELRGEQGALPITSSPVGRLWNVGILMGVFYAFQAP